SVEKVYLQIIGSNDPESLNKYNKMYQMLPIKDRADMDITGRDLMNWFDQKGGPWVKEMLLKIERAILDGEVENKKMNLKEWLMKCNQI
ncbi:MAG TPA: CCA tRNA nucleotidyltransferase, partial [Bacillales bacterium]|nr:CCA tRNA nucleotidyltransferase [Bacillales bacterium]